MTSASRSGNSLVQKKILKTWIVQCVNPKSLNDDFRPNGTFYHKSKSTLCTSLTRLILIKLVPNSKILNSKFCNSKFRPRIILKIFFRINWGVNGHFSLVAPRVQKSERRFQTAVVYVITHRLVGSWKRQQMSSTVWYCISACIRRRNRKFCRKKLASIYSRLCDRQLLEGGVFGAWRGNYFSEGSKARPLENTSMLNSLWKPPNP